MKKTLKYIGAALIFIGALTLAAIGILMLIVIVGLLTNENSNVEDEPAQVEIIRIHPEETRNALSWNQKEQAGTVLLENGAEKE